MTTKKLKKVTLKRWIKALRSGKYEQGIGSLHKNGMYCCLGVYGKLCGLSDETMKPWGLLSEISQVEIPSGIDQQDLAYMNDGEDRYEQHSFKEIARILEGKMKPKED